MTLFAATISCRIKAAFLNGRPDDPVTFIHAIAANTPEEAHKQLQMSFPWAFYKHVKISWEVLAR